MIKNCSTCNKSEPEVKFAKAGLVCYSCRHQKERVIPKKELEDLRIEFAILTEKYKNLADNFNSLENKYEKAIKKYKKFKKLYTELSILNKFKNLNIKDE